MASWYPDQKKSAGGGPKAASPLTPAVSAPVPIHEAPPPPASRTFSVRPEWETPVAPVGVAWGSLLVDGGPGWCPGHHPLCREWHRLAREGTDRGTRYSSGQDKSRYSPNIEVARRGVEPPLPESESGVLPLDDRAAFGNRRGEPLLFRETAPQSALHSADPLQDGSALTLSCGSPFVSPNPPVRRTEGHRFYGIK